MISIVSNNILLMYKHIFQLTLVALFVSFPTFPSRLRMANPSLI